MPGGQPRPGTADGLGPDRGRRAARRVPGGGLDDRAPRRPPPPRHRRPGQRCGRAVRAGTAVPGARCRGRGAGRRGRGAPHGRAAGRRRAPGPARPADHPRRAARPAPVVCGGQAGCRRGVPTREHCPAGGVARAAARQAPRSRDNLPGRARRPRAGRLAASTSLARFAAGPPAAGAEGRRPVPGAGRGTVSGNWQTVYPGSRTCHPSMSPANLLANTYSCRQWSAVVAVNAQDVAGINLPVNSQTV